jgi:hypothetical protein
VRWLRANALAVIGLLAAAGGCYVAYAADKAVAPVATRVTKLEAHREDDRERQKRIEDKVDFLIERLVP